MSPARFVHLHVHTHYSLLDGATRIEPLIERARQLNMPAVAITDHGNMFGAVEFYTAAIRAGIKPIIGCELYLAPGDRRDRGRDGVNGERSGGNHGTAARDRAGGELRQSNDYFHLLLLAMNPEGYRNLMRLSSIGFTEGFYRKPRIDKQVLREFSAGLICTSTCLSGEIPRIFLARDRAAAEESARTYLDIFGPDRFFVELQDHNISEQRTLNPELIGLARRLGVGVIASNDVHYLDHDDVEAHDVLCCINTGRLLTDSDRFKFDSDQFYFKSPDEMAALFPSCPEALDNTLHVAGLCNVELQLGERHAPVFRVPDSEGSAFDVPAGADAAHLRRLVHEGAADRYGRLTPELRERIDYELDVITGKGFASYFLIVWDCVRFARERGIPIAARGSACSSVVAYCLRISAPDPLRYGLFFERFMDPDRDEMPDIDLDICQHGRAQVLDYVRGKYGHVAQIITFGTLKARAVIKDVARVMGLGFDEANNLTRLIPNELHMTLDRALAQEPELKRRYESDPTIRRIIDIARRLEGGVRNAGVHAAGVVVADEPLVNFLPLYKAPDADALVTQYDGPTVEKVGLLKMDFLGLRTLTTLERARQLAARSTGRDIDLEHLDLGDAKVYELFARGDTRGIFQFESGGMRDVLMRMKPNRIEDLIAANALYRPGPMEYIAEYIARKHGAKWTTPHPIMTEVLEETYGIMVYQEQVSRLVNRLGGIELKAAFRLAKAISKKKSGMIDALREPFLSGSVQRGVKRSVAERIFDDILKFGGYAFNKAHSTGYALVAYQTAWMKTYYPVEFMAALMTFEMSNSDRVAEYKEACRELGIRVEPPDINASEYDFVVERQDSPSAEESLAGEASASPAGRLSGAAIRFGLGAIKGVGAKAAAAIVQERQKAGRYRSLFEFCERVDVNVVTRPAIEALVCAGAFDKTGAMRKALTDALDRAIACGIQAQQDRRSGQMGLFEGGTAGPLPDQRTHALSNAEWTEAEMLAREKAVLGFYVTRHPLAASDRLLDACATASTTDLAAHRDGSSVVIGGLVSNLRMVTARGGRNPGRRMGIVTLEDLKGRVEAIVFPDDLARYHGVLTPDSIVFLEGEVDRKREEPSLRVSRVVPIGEAVEAFAAMLLIDLPAEAAVEPVIELLRAHRGECRVYLNISTGDGWIAQMECHPSLRVTCRASLLEALEGLLGHDAVRVLGPTRRRIPSSVVSGPGSEVSGGRAGP